MPPRISMLGGLRALAQPSTPRTFSTTTSLAAPPRDGSSPHHHTPSSTGSLLSLNRSPGPRRNTNHHPSGHQQQQQRPEPQHRAADAATRLLNRYKERATSSARNQQALHDHLREQKVSNDYLREMPRRWQIGDVYSPHDLSPVEMNKWRRRSQRKGDVVDALGIRPLDLYKNFSMIADFTKASGQIIHSDSTGLRPVNQRKIAKMIRRAQGMGIYPTIHGHPEVIRDQFYPSGYRR